MSTHKVNPMANSDWSEKDLDFRNINITFVNIMPTLKIPLVSQFFIDSRSPVSV